MNNIQTSELSIRLFSDFRDYYDHWFATTNEEPAVVFERTMQNKRTRLDDYQELSSYGFTVPEHATVAELQERITRGRTGKLAARYASKTHIIVFTDDTKHAGQGKAVIPIEQAAANYPNSLACVYFEQKGLSTSLRFLRIGRRSFWLRYESDDEWRSNCGNVQISLLKEFEPARSFGILPLFAIDFLLVRGKLVAMDFNTAPGVAGTGVETLLPAKQAFEEIAMALVTPKPAVDGIFPD